MQIEHSRSHGPLEAGMYCKLWPSYSLVHKVSAMHGRHSLRVHSKQQSGKTRSAIYLVLTRCLIRTLGFRFTTCIGVE